MSWTDTRVAVAQRDQGRCVKCAAPLGHSWECHHRLPRSGGGRDVPSNLISLCHTCHPWVHAHPSISYGDGWLVRRGSQARPAVPAAVPVLCAQRGRILLDDEYGYALAA